MQSHMDMVLSEGAEQLALLNRSWGKETLSVAWFAGVSLCYKKGFPSEDGISPASFPVYHFNITRFPDGLLPTPFI